jgi:exopolysaccharide biosynthesis polyprenyl glycosylphosphotransferase
VALEARTASYVAAPPGSSATRDVLGPAPEFEEAVGSPSPPSEALGIDATYAARPALFSLRARLLAFDLLSGAIAWIGLGLVLAPADGPVEKLARSVAALVATLISLYVGGLYRSRVCMKWANEFERIVLACLVGVVAFGGAGLSKHPPNVQDALLCGLACVITTMALRGHYRRWLSSQRARGRYLRNVVLVGGNDDSVALWRMLSTEPELGYKVTAVISQNDTDTAKPWDHLAAGATIADLPALARSTGAGGALISSNALSGRDVQWAVALGSAHGLHVQVWPGLIGVGSVRLREVPVSGEPFYYVEPHRTSRWQFAVKRAVDVAGSGICLVLLSPVLLLAAAAIKLERSGPILHRQLRIGLNGTPFTVYKLRTMTVGSEALAQRLEVVNERTDGPLYKNSNDPRATRVGRLLRPLSIDELPQLWNVLTGSMSLVGPRPALPHEVAQFDEAFQRRHSVRPGMTGLWQAKARENPSFNAYRRFDLQYVDNWSLRLDLSILSVTVPTVVAQAVRGFRRSLRRTASLGPSAGMARSRSDEPNDTTGQRVSDFPNFGDDLESQVGENRVQREFDPA